MFSCASGLSGFGIKDPLILQRCDRATTRVEVIILQSEGLDVETWFSAKVFSPREVSTFYVKILILLVSLFLKLLESFTGIKPH